MQLASYVLSYRMYLLSATYCVPVLSYIVGGVFITCAVCGHIELTQIFAESSPTLNRLAHVPRWTRLSPFFLSKSYEKTVSAKDNLKCYILAGEGGRPGNEATCSMQTIHSHTTIVAHFGCCGAG